MNYIESPLSSVSTAYVEFDDNTLAGIAPSLVSGVLTLYSKSVVKKSHGRALSVVDEKGVPFSVDIDYTEDYVCAVIGEFRYLLQYTSCDNGKRMYVNCSIKGIGSSKPILVVHNVTYEKLKSAAYVPLMWMGDNRIVVVDYNLTRRNKMSTKLNIHSINLKSGSSITENLVVDLSSSKEINVKLTKDNKLVVTTMNATMSVSAEITLKQI